MPDGADVFADLEEYPGQWEYAAAARRAAGDGEDARGCGR